MALDFYYLFRYLENMSFFQIVVPFLLIFAIVFTLLEKTGIFGEKAGSGVNILVAILLSLLAVVNTRVVEFMNFYLGHIALTIAIFGVTLLLFMGLLKLPHTGLKVASVILAIFGVLWFLIEAQYYSPYGGFSGFMNVFTIWLRPYMVDILVLAAIVIAGWFIVASLKKVGLAGSN
jgi:hypothetical protein